MLNNGGAVVGLEQPSQELLYGYPRTKCRMTKKHHYSPKHHASEKLLKRTQTDARKSCMSRHLANQKASDIQLVS
jgi:hypothetical protein